MTIISSLLNFIAKKIGNTSMGTTATTITGAIAELSAKTNAVTFKPWSGLQPQTSVTNVLATFDVTPGKYLVLAKNGNGLSNPTRCPMAIRSYTGTTTVAVNGDATGYGGRNNWCTCYGYFEYSDNGSIRVTSYSKVQDSAGTDPVLSGNAICIKLM